MRSSHEPQNQAKLNFNTWFDVGIWTPCHHVSCSRNQKRVRMLSKILHNIIARTQDDIDSSNSSDAVRNKRKSITRLTRKFRDPHTRNRTCVKRMMFIASNKSEMLTLESISCWHRSQIGWINFIERSKWNPQSKWYYAHAAEWVQLVINDLWNDKTIITMWYGFDAYCVVTVWTIAHRHDANSTLVKLRASVLLLFCQHNYEYVCLSQWDFIVLEFYWNAVVHTRTKRTKL